MSMPAKNHFETRGLPDPSLEEYNTIRSETAATAENPPATLYDDTYDKAEVFAWGGRPWVGAQGGQQKDPSPLLSQEPGFTVLTYNVFADCKCSNVRYSTAFKWEHRSRTLIKEIASYNADILCLQDVDHFAEFWRPQLMLLGYDSLYKQRTCKRDAHYEGVVIAYRRNLLQLFKSEALEFNKTRKKINTTEMGASFGERLITDDVGLIALLQPWGQNDMGRARTDLAEDDDDEGDAVVSIMDKDSVSVAASKSSLNTALKTENTQFNRNPPITRRVEAGICVVCAQFSQRPQDSIVRFYQAQYLTKRVEAANSEFHLPIAMGVSLYDSPTSAAYHVLRTGRKPLKPQSPRQPAPPKAVPYCRGSCCVKWRPPHFTKEDPPILSYKIAWRPGGNLALGFTQNVQIDPLQALAYEERIDEHGVRKIFQKNDLEHNISGLSSDLPYEFIVTAVNAIGEGVWSNPSMPVVCPNPERAPPMPEKVVLKNYHEVREMREGSNMHNDDWDVEKAISSDPVNVLTGLTPRLVDGRKNPEVPKSRILPMSVNPREGWRSDLKGGVDDRVVHELTTIPNMEKTKIRDRESGLFLPELGLADSPRGKRAMVIGEQQRKLVNPLTYTKGVEAEQEKLLQTLRIQHLVGLEEGRAEEENESQDGHDGKFSQSQALVGLSSMNGESMTQSVVQNPGGSTMSLSLDLPHAGLTKSRSITTLKEKMHHHSLDFMGHFKQSTFDKELKQRIADRAMLEGGVAFDQSTLGEDYDERGPGGLDWGNDNESVADDNLPAFESMKSNLNTPGKGKGLVQRERSGTPSRGFGFGPGDTASFEETGLTTATVTAPAVQNSANGVNEAAIHAPSADTADTFDTSHSFVEGQHPCEKGKVERDRNRKEVGEDAARLTFAITTALAGRTREAVYAAEDSDKDEEGLEGACNRPPTDFPEDSGAAHEGKVNENGDMASEKTLAMRSSNVSKRQSTIHTGDGAAELSAGVDAIMDELAGDDDGSAFSASRQESEGFSRADSLGSSSIVKLERRIAAHESWECEVENEERAKLLDIEKANLAQLRDRSRVAARLNDDTFLDGTDLFYHVGKPHHRTLHDLILRSAYEQYSAGGEPLFTTSEPSEGHESGVQCQDYIFYSKNQMHARKVLAIPDLGMLRGDNPREPLCKADPWTKEPTGVLRNCYNKQKQFEPKGGYGNVNASKASIESAKRVLRQELKSSFDMLERTGGQESGFEGVEAGRLTSPNYWAGIYTPLVDKNEGRSMNWLPNEEYCSSHVALVAHVAFIDGALGNEWQ